MPLPKAVQEQEDRANKILEEMAAKAEGENPDKYLNLDGGALGTPTEGVVEPKPEPVAKPEANQAAAPEDDKWEQRYKVLKGKYDAEMPRMQDQVSQLNQMVLNMQNQQPEQQAAKVTEAQGTDSLAKLREDYGDEIARPFEDQQKLIKQLEEKIEGLTATTHANTQNTYRARVNAGVPDYNQVNNDREFVKYLGKADGYSGRTLLDTLRAADQAGNDTLVVQIFNDFKATKAEVKPEPNGKVKPKPQVSPGTSNPATMPADKPVFTRAQVKEIYADIAKGRYDRNPKRKAALEAAINEAHVEGRIRS